MTETRRRWARRGIGLAALLALVVATTFAITGTEEDKPRLTAVFADASPLVAGNLVKVDGVPVGEISDIRVDKGKAVVEMELERAALPVHRDATAKVRAMSLLGERYLELDTGSSGRPAMDMPGTIPLKRTSRSVGVDDLLNTLDDPTSASLAALVTTLGEGTAGQGKNIDAALKALEPAVSDTAKLGAVLDEQNDVLAALVDKATPVAKALASGRGDRLDRLVGSTTKMLTALAQQRAELDATIKRLPATLRKAQRTLAVVSGVSKATRGTLRDIRPVTDNLPEISAELRAFADSADPAVASLPAVLRRAEKLLDQAGPVIRDLGPGGKALRSVSASGDRILGKLQPRLTMVLDFVRGWALSTNGGDGISNYFRGVVPTTPQSLLQAPGVSLPGAGQGGKRPRTPLPGADGGGLPDLPPLLGGDSESATGLSDQQERSLLGQLLGGN